MMLTNYPLNRELVAERQRQRRDADRARRAETAARRHRPGSRRATGGCPSWLPIPRPVGAGR